MTNETQLDWHAAFFAALQAELVDYQDVLQFEQEHPLNENPLRIDAIVIKMPPGTKIKKNFAENFKGHNLFEYKSPEDSLTVSDYIKGIGYACLYQAVENVKHTKITLTFVCTKKPSALLAYLKNTSNNRYTITEKHPGIYNITGEHFPVQIIESKRLPPDENFWLTSLKKNADKAGLEKALEVNSVISRIINLGSYWYVVSRTNKNIVEKVIDMTAEQTTEIWGEALEKNGYNQKIKNEGMTTLANEARELFEKGIDPSEILRMIMSKASSPT